MASIDIYWLALHLLAGDVMLVTSIIANIGVDFRPPVMSLRAWFWTLSSLS